LDSENVREIDADVTEVKNLDPATIIDNTFITENIVTNTLVTNTLYAEYARIAQLTVDELSTGWEKITNYLTSSTADVNYLYIHDQTIEFITASTDGLSTEQAEDRDGNGLYWTDETHTGVTTDATDYPVTMYAYTELVKANFTFTLVGSEYVPQLSLGAGAGVSGHPEYGKGYIWKDTTGLLLKYITSTGVEHYIRIGESGIEGVDWCELATNGEEIEVDDSSEVVAAEKDITFLYRSKIKIDFSCKITLDGAASLTAIPYVNNAALPYQPTHDYSEAGTYTFGFVAFVGGISSGKKTVEVKLQTSANSGTIEIGHAIMAVQVFVDKAPDYSPGGLKGYVFGGHVSGAIDDNDEYDPDTWTSKTNVPSPARYGSGCAVISAKAYLAGGNGPIADNDEYTVDSWASKTNMPSPARNYARGGTINSKAYFGTGASSGSTLLADMDEYVVDSWTSKTDAPAPGRREPGWFVLSEKYYLAYGLIYSGGSNTYLLDVDEYTVDTWTSKSDAPSPARVAGSSTVVIGKGYVWGGYNNSFLQDNDEYSPAASTWTSKANLSRIESSGTSFYLMSKGYFTGGWAGVSNYDYNDEYVPDTWISKSSMPSPGRKSSAAASIE
jgi:hypothetical protein